MQRSPCTLILNVVLAVVICGLLGCGKSEEKLPNRAVVDGHVTFDGKPLPGGTVSFTLESDPTFRVNALLKPDGRYTSSRVPIGMCLVTVETESLKLGNLRDYVEIPRHYSIRAESGLKVDIKPGDNHNVDFVLEKK